jgi:hypothetical protein
VHAIPFLKNKTGAISISWFLVRLLHVFVLALVLIPITRYCQLKLFIGRQSKS